jgi:predicted transcriptional regulator
MYSAYLSYAQVQEYLQYLTDKRLISFDEETHAYKLTEQGLHFLRVYDEISDIVSLKNDEIPGTPGQALLE